MKLIYVKPPKKFSLRGGDRLASYYVEDLEKSPIDVAAYWYESGDYDGDGEMLFHTPEGWGYGDLGHCSCYGPIDHLADNLDAYKLRPTLEQVRENMSAELAERCEPLFAVLAEYKEQTK